MPLLIERITQKTSHRFTGYLIQPNIYLCLQISWLAVNFHILSEISWLCQISNIFSRFFAPKTHPPPPSSNWAHRGTLSWFWMKDPSAAGLEPRKFENMTPKFRTQFTSKKGTSTKLHQFCSGSLICALWKRKHISSTKTPPIFGLHVNSNWGVVTYRTFNSFGGWTFSLKLNPCTDWFKLVVLGCFLGWYLAGNLSNRSQSNWKNHPLKGAGCLMHPQKTNMTMKKKTVLKMYFLLNMVIFHCHVSLLEGHPKWRHTWSRKYMFQSP